MSDKPKFSQERTSNIPEDNEKRSILYNNTQRRGPQEQFHHYLGAVTGELHRSHFYNTPILSRLFELEEFRNNDYRLNQGDINLFDAARKHRDDFIKYGRHSVAPNIRKLLRYQEDIYR
ncbi:MAG: hypothetical protein R2857_14440 [Vampirovibrionales bacterium]